MMNLKRLLPLFMLFSLAASACGAVTGGTETRTLTVTGTGTVSVPPDIVVVSLGVQTVGPDIARAVASNNEAAGAVQAAARELGVADEDIRTTYFYVSTQQQYDEFGNVTGEVTYWVDNTISLTLRDTSKLGDLLEAAVDAGANSISGVTFSVDDPSAAERKPARRPWTTRGSGPRCWRKRPVRRSASRSPSAPATSAVQSPTTTGRTPASGSGAAVCRSRLARPM
jgi:uncharacterized protein YggE